MSEEVVKRQPAAYYLMVVRAIKARVREQKKAVKAGLMVANSKKAGYASVIYIRRWILAHYDIDDSPRVKKHLGEVIDKAVEEKKLHRLRNSVRLTDKATKVKKVKKVAKKASPKKKDKKDKKKDDKKKKKKAKKDDEEKSPKKKKSKDSPKKKKSKEEDKEKSPKKKRTKKAKKDSSPEKEDAKKKKKIVRKRKAKKDTDSSPEKEGATPPVKKQRKSPIKKNLAEDMEAASSAVRWHYQDRGWKPYADEADRLIEEAYQDYLKDPGGFDVRAVKSGNWNYQVDFRDMKQTNIDHANHTVRDIKRC